VAWDLLKMYGRAIPNTTFNESELRGDFPNGSRITLYGADNPDSLRGVGLWGVVFDEYSQQPSNIFTEIIRPALSDHKGYGIWIGTPKGKNDFWTIYDNATRDNDWLSVFLKASESGILPPEELADARKLMSPDEYEQEYECSFDAAIKGAYYAHELYEARQDGRVTSVPYDPMLGVSTWWDLGIGDATAIIFMQNFGKEWRMIDCYENSGEGLEHYKKVIDKKGYNYVHHYAPHDIEVREMGTGKSRREMAKSLGMKFKIAPKLSIEDGINAGRARFRTLWIDQEKCAQFLHCISLYHKEWDDKRGVFKDRPFHDFTSHFADAYRYWAVTKDRAPGESHSIYRPPWKAFAKR